ncbi:MAG TPA: hypothetical protein VI790_03175 [Candidatus Nanoarchaeia archaeon]|nr:hypothetical protein [Candidatus Nanoarchaeia archaeon]
MDFDVEFKKINKRDLRSAIKKVSLICVVILITSLIGLYYLFNNFNYAFIDSLMLVVFIITLIISIGIMVPISILYWILINPDMKFEESAVNNPTMNLIKYTSNQSKAGFIKLLATVLGSDIIGFILLLII